VYARSEGGSDAETLATAIRELVAEVRSLRNRVALLDGGEGMT